MISSNIYNLRRKYVPNGKEEKDQSNSKFKVYTFNQNDTYERDFFDQNSHQNQSLSLQSSYQQRCTHQTRIQKFTKPNYQKNKQNRQSSPSQLNRYLKEYQYNCYKLDENQPSIMKAKTKQIQDCFSSDKKLGVIQRHGKYGSKQIQKFYEADKISLKLLNRSLSNQNSGLKQQSLDDLTITNMGRNLHQQLKERIHSIPSKALTFNDFSSEAKPEPLCSKEEMSLIKMLRIQIDQLKSQIQNKNVYILALQNKLENHLIERIQVEKELQENTIFLQNKINQLELQNKQILEKLTFSQNQLIEQKNLNDKIRLLFSSPQSISSKTVFQFNDNDQYLNPVLKSISELDTYQKLIGKIHQMKVKIQNSENIRSSQHSYIFSKNEPQQLDLKSLWKWLKKIGKEYEIMKKRVTAFENPAPLIS